MKKIKLIFALHNHQPVGNFDHVFEESYQKSYLPLVEVIRDHPWFRCDLHYTGPLLEWLSVKHPEFIGMLREMALAGQIEMMGGGFYEPILALLPDEDKSGQIKKLSNYIKDTFGKAPGGIWLAERVWEPHLPQALAAAGVGWVVVDDFHFKMTGLRDEELTGYFVTEEQGSIVKVFPGSEKLRYLVPFSDPQDMIEHLRNMPDAGENTLAVMADDGEKFGCWPGTYKWVYEEGWLRKFLRALRDNSDWIETTTFSDYAAIEPSRGRVYLPTCSYMEMGEWSLPTKAMIEYEDFLEELKSRPDFDQKRLFVKGGFFRSFLQKYPEANALHKKMLQVSRKTQRAMSAVGGKSGPRKAEITYMLDSLWSGQCNDALWHGVFGGLYLPHLRDALYRHLILADEMADRLIHGDTGYITAEEADYDGDLDNEVSVNNSLCAFMIDPAEGGIMYELDYRPVSMNFMNTLARREEAYHRKIAAAAGLGKTDSGGAKTIHERMDVKEEGLEEYLVYDWYRRASMIDHFMNGELDFKAFKRSAYNEAGDFVKSRYDHFVVSDESGVLVSMSRLGTVGDQSIRVAKSVKIKKDSSEIDILYTLTNESDEELNSAFGVEFNFSLLAGDSSDRYFEVPGHKLKSKKFASQGEQNNVGEISMVDEWLGYRLSLSFGENAKLWRFPIETVSQSEAGYERVYQGSVVMPLWMVSIAPGGAWESKIRLVMSKR